MDLIRLLLGLHAIIAVFSEETPCRGDGIMNYSYQGLTKLPSCNPTCDNKLLFRGNELVNITADDFESCQALRRLDVSQNQLTYVEAGSFVWTIHLTALTMSENRIQSLEQVFKGAVSLTDIDLADNDIEYLDSGSFQGTRALRRIILSDNRISRINETTFNYCRNLRTLNLAHNRIEVLLESVFALNENLVTLDLRNNRLRNLPPGLFVGLKSLTYLMLSDNPLAPLYFHVNSRFIHLLADNCGQAAIPHIQCNATDNCVIEMELWDNNLECNCYVLEVNLSSNRTVRCIDEDTGAYSPLKCVDPHSTTTELPPRTTASKTNRPGENKLGVPTMSELEGHRPPWLLPVVIPPAILVISGAIAFFVIHLLRKSRNASGDPV